MVTNIHTWDVIFPVLGGENPMRKIDMKVSGNYEENYRISEKDAQGR